MSLPLEFHPGVSGEVDDAYAWYEPRRAGLGTDFLDEVQRVLAEITANPARFGFADADIREGLLTRFRTRFTTGCSRTGSACWRSSTRPATRRGGSRA